MPGSANCFRVIGQYVECQTGFRFLQSGFKRQPKFQQPIKQMMFGELQFLPPAKVLLDRKVGDGSIMATSRTQCFVGVRRYDPIACGKLHIRTKPECGVRITNGTPAIALALQRHDLVQRGAKAQPITTIFATRVFEIDQVRAIAATKQLHLMFPPIEMLCSLSNPARTRSAGRLQSVATNDR